MRSFKVFGLILYLLYFSALLFGYPEYDIVAKNIQDEIAEVGQQSKIAKKSIQKKKEEGGFYWQMGLIDKVSLQTQARLALQEELLEGDGRPQNIFRDVNRALLQDAIFLVLSILWCGLIFLCLLNHRLHYYFLENLINIILLVSILCNLTLIMTQHLPSGRVNGWEKVDAPLRSLADLGLFAISFFLLFGACIRYIGGRQKNAGDAIRQDSFYRAFSTNLICACVLAHFSSF